MKRTNTPLLKSPGQRKHKKLESTINLPLEGSQAMEARAISTPLHTVNEVRFNKEVLACQNNCLVFFHNFF